MHTDLAGKSIVQLSITVPACLIGPLSTLPPNPALSQKGGAQWDSQWQFFLLLHSCKQSNTQRNTQLNPPDQISCWTLSTTSCCSMLKEFWGIMVWNLLMSIQFMDALFNVAFKGNIFPFAQKCIRFFHQGMCQGSLHKLIDVTWCLNHSLNIRCLPSKRKDAAMSFPP